MSCCLVNTFWRFRGWYCLRYHIFTRKTIVTMELWYNHYIQSGENGITYFQKNESWHWATSHIMWLWKESLLLLSFTFPPHTSQWFRICSTFCCSPWVWPPVCNMTQTLPYTFWPWRWRQHFCWTVGVHLQVCMVSQPRRHILVQTCFVLTTLSQW